MFSLPFVNVSLPFFCSKKIKLCSNNLLFSQISMNVSTTHVPMAHSVLMVSTTSRAIVDRGIRENAVKPVRLGLRLDYVLESICSRFFCHLVLIVKLKERSLCSDWLPERSRWAPPSTAGDCPEKKKRKTKVTKRHTIFVIFGEFQG